MNYRLIVNVFSREMAGQPIPIAVSIPEKLSHILTHLTVTHVRLTVDENPAPTSIPLLDFKTGGKTPEVDRPELKRLFLPKSA